MDASNFFFMHEVAFAESTSLAIAEHEQMLSELVAFP